MMTAGGVRSEGRFVPDAGSSGSDPLTAASGSVPGGHQSPVTRTRFPLKELSFATGRHSVAVTPAELMAHPSPQRALAVRFTSHLLQRDFIYFCVLWPKQIYIDEFLLYFPMKTPGVKNRNLSHLTRMGEHILLSFLIQIGKCGLHNTFIKKGL